ncbi:hypothetical protein MMC22_002665 [Lobaria immixta]|nr:hypothetical protein [Lobaria immixta]
MATARAASKALRNFEKPENAAPQPVSSATPLVPQARCQGPVVHPQLGAYSATPIPTIDPPPAVQYVQAPALAPVNSPSFWYAQAPAFTNPLPAVGYDQAPVSAPINQPTFGNAQAPALTNPPPAVGYFSTLGPRRRSASPDELVDTSAQRDALRRSRRQDELADIRKQIKNLQGQKPRTKDEGMDPCFFPLKTRFSAVKAKYFSQIFDNNFDPIDLTRLCNDVSFSRAHSKSFDLGASEYDIRGLAILIRCLGVYFQRRLHFASDDKVRALSAAFQKYEDYLCMLYSIYTWESVWSLHLVFHQMAINDGVDNPENWSLRTDTSLENSILTKRNKPLNSLHSP